MAQHPLLLPCLSTGWDSGPWDTSGAIPVWQGRGAELQPEHPGRHRSAGGWHCQEGERGMDTLNHCKKGQNTTFGKQDITETGFFKIFAGGLGCVVTVLMKGSRHKLGASQKSQLTLTKGDVIPKPLGK